MDIEYSEDTDFDSSASSDNGTTPATTNESPLARSSPHQDSSQPNLNQPTDADGTVVEATQAATVGLQEASTEDGWRALVQSDIPDCTQAQIADLPHLQDLYDAYHSSYADPTTPNATRMNQAKALAFALLTHYYPISQDYIVEPSSLGPVVQNGMNFVLKADDGSDPSHTQRPRAQTNPGLSRAEWAYVRSTKWHWIKPEDIAGFVVLLKFEITDDETGEVTYKNYPFTYCAIMIDVFDELPPFSKANMVHRGDILADALSRNAKIRDGYGILFYGPRLEFYDFDEDNDEDTITPCKDEADDLAEYLAEYLAMDLRHVELTVVDRVFRQQIAPRGIIYSNNTVAEGV